MRSQLTTGHRNKRAVISLNNFQVADYEAIVKSNAAESAQSIFGALHEFDSDFGYFHDVTPDSVTGQERSMLYTTEGYTRKNLCIRVTV